MKIEIKMCLNDDVRTEANMLKSLCRLLLDSGSDATLAPAYTADIVKRETPAAKEEAPVKPKQGRSSRTTKPVTPPPAEPVEYAQPNAFKDKPATSEKAETPEAPVTKDDEVKPQGDGVTLDYMRDIRPLIINLVQVTDQNHLVSFLKEKFALSSALNLKPEQLQSAKQLLEQEIEINTPPELNEDGM